MGLPARIALVLLLFTAGVEAQTVSSQALMPDKDTLPDKPTPRGNFLTRPFYDKPVAIFAEIDTGAAAWDDFATRRVIDHGGYERNPLMRPFVHNSGMLAAETVCEMWVAAFLGDRMRHSRHGVLRNAWWLPQALNTAARLYGGINSTVLLTR